MFEIGNGWIKKFSLSRSAKLDEDGKIIDPIKPIEPDSIFTKPIVGIYASSSSAPRHWYAAGDLLQAYIVPFGSAGYAQGDLQKCVLWRHHIFNFSSLPYTSDTRYLLSFVPRYYLPDITISAWEYIGTNQPVSNNELKTLLLRTNATQTQSLSLLKKIMQKKS